MKIREIKARSIIVKSGLPGVDFVINPYVGCLHGCLYCYARFMNKFTGHLEPWGSFVDIKINAPDLIPAKTEKYRNKTILISSVTDAYQAVERKYQLTRQILEKLILLEPRLQIITKTDLVLRDIDLLKQFKYSQVAISLSFLNDKIIRALEPLAPMAQKRIDTLKELHGAGIKTAVFVSPIFPKITDWRNLVNQTKSFVDEYWFENLNLYFSIRSNIYGFLRKTNPQLINKYREIYLGGEYWNNEEKMIREFCKKNQIIYRTYFHHKRK